ncbi:unnamed protein product [Phyllotreta striolata]|uniref:Menorin-like domain-containing protein n=1 Tax=Phyllotreta striolata TaxID=444603 RepID=A0A9N9TFJ1_PHYSR|nr:unnamed protein product [Phyllotreta striolata]
MSIWLCSVVVILTTTTTTVMSNKRVQDFFPDVRGNLTKVTWAHAVNNQSYLESVLEQNDVMMIEADVTMGKLHDGDGLLPIMAHPPSKVSDLSLKDFLEQVEESNARADRTPKGVKLDFKDIESFNAAMGQLQRADQKRYPLWINADILPGPGNSPVKPVDSAQFLGKCKSLTGGAVLSLGWTTTVDDDAAPAGYSIDNVKAMMDVVTRYKLTNSITFPVRASLVARSGPEMQALLRGFEDSTLTVWSAAFDEVDVDRLRKVILDIGVEKVYLDVPDEIRERLELDKNGASRSAKVALTSLLVVLVVLVVL